MSKMFEKTIRWIRFNLRYLGQPPWDTGVSPPELISFLNRTLPGKALDLGCGTGTNLLTMAEYGWFVVGVDFAWLSVLRARAKLRHAGYDPRVVQGDVAGGLDLDAPFDLVLDIGCYHSLSFEERMNYRKNLGAWLSPGGAYLLYAHRQRVPGDAHGITEDDFASFGTFLILKWRDDGDEVRPDGGGGRAATWAQYDRIN